MTVCHRLALLALLGCAACAAVSTDPLRRGHRVEQTPDCSASRVAIGADAVAALISAIAFAGAVFDPDADDDAVETLPLLGPVMLGAAASAFWGHRALRRCDRAFREHDDFVTRRFLRLSAQQPAEAGDAE